MAEHAILNSNDLYRCHVRFTRNLAVLPTISDLPPGFQTAAVSVKRLTYDAQGLPGDYRTIAGLEWDNAFDMLYCEKDQCQLLTAFLRCCQNLQNLTVCRMPETKMLDIRMLLSSCPLLEHVAAIQCTYNIDVATASSTDGHYYLEKAHRRVILPQITFSMKGNPYQNFNRALSPLLWPYAEDEIEEHIKWIARNIVLLKGKGKIAATQELIWRMGLKENLRTLDLNSVDYSSLPYFMLLRLTSIITTYPVEGMDPPMEHFLYQTPDQCHRK